MLGFKVLAALNEKKSVRRCSGFQVTGIIEGFLGFEILISGIVLGWKICQVFFFGWIDLSKDFLGVIKTILRFAVVLAYDKVRWYDEETNTNIQFRMFFFFGPVIVLGFVGSPREFSGF